MSVLENNAISRPQTDHAPQDHDIWSVQYAATISHSNFSMENGINEFGFQ
jgi:hypothetical protein